MKLLHQFLVCTVIIIIIIIIIIIFLNNYFYLEMFHFKMARRNISSTKQSQHLCRSTLSLTLTYITIHTKYVLCFIRYK